MAVQRLAQTCAQHRHALLPTSQQVLVVLLGWLGYVPVSKIKPSPVIHKQLGLPHRKKVVCSRVLLWRHRCFGGYHPWFRLCWFSCVPFLLHFYVDGTWIWILIAAAVLYGFMAGTICNFATQLKFYLDCDDALDVRFTTFPLSCQSTYWHVIAIDFRLSRHWWSYRKYPNCNFCSEKNRSIWWSNYQWRLVGSPLYSTCLPSSRFNGWLGIFIYHDGKNIHTFIFRKARLLTYLYLTKTAILWAMHYIPPLRLRVPDHVERIGIDESDMGEFAYDYVGPQSQSEVRAMAYGQSSGYELRTPEFKETIVTQFWLALSWARCISKLFMILLCVYVVNCNWSSCNQMFDTECTKII